MRWLSVRMVVFGVICFLLMGTVKASRPTPAGLANPLVPRTAPTRLTPPKPPPLRTGFIPPPMDLSHLKGDRMPPGVRAASLPGRWDWRELGKVTSVKSQGDCGSCYAFATIAQLESKLLIDGAGAYDLSENNAKECNWEEANGYIDAEGHPSGGCDGGDTFMLANLFSQKGTVLESCDPYVSMDVPCKSGCQYQKTVLDWRIINGNVLPNPEVLKAYIQNYGPLYTSMYAGDGDAWQYEFRNYNGSYTLYHPGTEMTNHEVLIVGWDDNLVHAGGRGGWIVKNSWGANWGGTCGYGNERGHFTIAYGSASIGMYASFTHDWQNYDPSGGLLYYDDAGWRVCYPGCGNTTAWGLAKFVPNRNTKVTRVEFWTTDITTDVDVYIYDNFDGNRPSNPLFSQQNLSYNEAGYHSVRVNPPLPVTYSNDIVAVVKFNNLHSTCPVAGDNRGPWESQRTYFSCSGGEGSWVDAGLTGGVDVAIRLRTSDAVPTPTNTPTRPAATPTRRLTPVTGPYRIRLPIVLKNFSPSGTPFLAPVRHRR